MDQGCEKGEELCLGSCDLFFIEVQPTKHHGESACNDSHKR